MDLFVGGEFYDDPSWRLDQPALSFAGARFLSGGRASLKVIADYLLAQGIGRALLPAYLCPSILDVLEQRGLAWGFYRVNEDLSIDLDDLAGQAEDYHALYFINYFGFPHSPRTLSALRDIQKNGVLLVEDNAQAGFPARRIGDFTFNSLRKLAPFDGSYLFTQRDIQPFIRDPELRVDRRLALIRAYRRELRAYLLEGRGSYRRLTALYARAENAYDHDFLVSGDPREREQIERQDWPAMRRARRENYRCLMKKIAGLPELIPIYPNLSEDASPLGLPVYVNGLARDALCDYLGQQGIGLFTHWAEIEGDARLAERPASVSMARRILTLACDQRVSRRQIDYLVHHLKAGIACLKNASA